MIGQLHLRKPKLVFFALLCVIYFIGYYSQNDFHYAEYTEDVLSVLQEIVFTIHNHNSQFEMNWQNRIWKCNLNFRKWNWNKFL